VRDIAAGLPGAYAAVALRLAREMDSRQTG
jgi:hypothetical protein